MGWDSQKTKRGNLHLQLDFDAKFHAGNRSMVYYIIRSVITANYMTLWLRQSHLCFLYLRDQPIVPVQELCLWHGINMYERYSSLGLVKRSTGRLIFTSKSYLLTFREMSPRTTMTHGISEANSNFRVKWCTTGKA